MGAVSLGLSVGASCFERNTAASDLGKKDVRCLLAGGIESSAGPRNNNEPHHLKQKDLDEDVAEQRETGKIVASVVCHGVRNLFWVATRERSDECPATD
jgi:hypothetical protein